MAVILWKGEVYVKDMTSSIARARVFPARTARLCPSDTIARSSILTRVKATAILLAETRLGAAGRRYVFLKREPVQDAPVVVTCVFIAGRVAEGTIIIRQLMFNCNRQRTGVRYASLSRSLTHSEKCLHFALIVGKPIASATRGPAEVFCFSYRGISLMMRLDGAVSVPWSISSGDS